MARGSRKHYPVNLSMIFIVLVIIAFVASGCAAPIVVEPSNVDETVYVRGKPVHRNLWIAIGIVAAGTIIALSDNGDTVVHDGCHYHHDKCHR